MSSGVLEPPNRWGLLPDRAPGEPFDGPRVLRHWFVHFNPLYFLSALSVLYGVFLVNRSLDRLAAGTSPAPQIALFAVVQAYELLIIAGASFLVRRARVVRPAVLLILVEALFLFDGTLRLESVLLRGPGRIDVSVVWWLLTLGKVWAAAAALRVRLTAAHYASIAGAAAALALAVHLLAHPATNKLLVLQVAAWLGALVLLALDVTDAPPMSPLAVMDAERARAERCSRGVFRILTGAYFFHVWVYIVIVGPAEGAWIAALVPQLGALFLRAALVRPQVREVWRSGALVVAAALPAAQAVPYALFVVGAVFVWRVWRGARSGLAAGAAVAASIGVWLLGWPGWGAPLPERPDLLSWPALVLVLALILAAWTVRDRLAMALLVAVAAAAGYRLMGRLLPRSELGLGVLSLVAGFALFVIGVAVNWRLRTREERVVS